MSEKKAKQIGTEDDAGKGVKLVLERNAFYYDQYKKSYFILIGMFLVNILLIVAIVYKVMTPVKPEYFASTGTGRILPEVPLTQPVWGDNYVLQWTADKVAAAFNIDYIHWRSQLQKASSAFTQAGWLYFMEALKKSGILNSVIKGQRIGNVEITGSPSVVNKMVVDGRYAWQVRLPLSVQYIRPGISPIRQNYFVSVIVLRMPVENYPQRLAISNFLPEVTGT